MSQETGNELTVRGKEERLSDKRNKVIAKISNMTIGTRGETPKSCSSWIPKPKFLGSKREVEFSDAYGDDASGVCCSLAPVNGLVQTT